MLDNLCVSLGKPGEDGIRPNVMVVLADSWVRQVDVLRFARVEVFGQWRVGCSGDLPQLWGERNPKPDGEQLMWFLVKEVELWK